MSKKLTDSRDIYRFGMLCCFLYAASYITRINFTAMIAKVIEVEGITKSMAAFVTTALFVSYGSGQLIFGITGDKISPEKLIAAGMTSTTLLNFLMFFAENIYVMAAIWFLNGFAQAIMWPSIARITSDYLSLEGYKKLCVSVAVASNVATVLIYVAVPFLLSFMHYREIFLLCGGVGAAVCFLWIWSIPKFSEKRVFMEEEKSEAQGIFEKNSGALPLASLLFLGVAVLFQGILKDGITTWTPSYIIEVFKMPASFSIMITVLLPLLNIVFYKFGGYVHKKFIKNEVLCGAAFFMPACIISVIMSTVYDANPLLCSLMAGTITGCLSTVNLMLVCMIPGRFEKQGKVATVSGLLNFITYVGSALSTYVIARVAEICGWRVTTLFWAALALMGTLICVIYYFKNKDK